MYELPPYSVLMSVYYKEQAAYLQSSLVSMSTQTIKPDEIVLICDGMLSSALEEIIRDFDLQYPNLLHLVRLKNNVGLGEALNQGLKCCKNEYVVRMDSDDISLPERVERQLTYIAENHLDICGCTIVEFNENGREYIKTVPQKHQEILRYAKRRNPFNHPSVVFKNSIIMAAGGYKSMPFFEDYYLWIRALQNDAISGNAVEPLLRMRSNTAFYTRRGGFSYACDLLIFWNQVAKLGFVNRFNVFMNITFRLPIALMPSWIRQKIYCNLLRMK